MDAWDPAYGAGDLTAEAPGGESSAELDTGVESPAPAWRPVTPAPGARAPDVVLLVDGVRRNDARVWITDDAGEVHPGVAASYAAGVVRCDLARGAAEVTATTVERGMFSAAAGAPAVGDGAVRYVAYQVGGREADLTLGVQRQMRALEVTISRAARQGTPDVPLIVDGPLHGRGTLPGAVGYIKTHRVEYLPPALTAVVTGLAAGQRSPVFRLGTSWHRYSWYLRLPGTGGGPWNGIVRVECAPDLDPADAIALADSSAVTLPRFASAAYKDPRAPQNLIPIAGLERRLRALLGDARLLHRALVRLAAGTG